MTSNPLRTAQIIGFSSALFFSGFSFATSKINLPPLYDLPATASTPAFSYVFHEGARVVLPVGIIAALANGVAAYLSDSVDVQGLHVAAALSVFSTQPWTRLVMWGGIQRLLEISNNTDKPENQTEGRNREVVQLLQTWTWQNYIRALLAGASAGLALYAAY